MGRHSKPRSWGWGPKKGDLGVRIAVGVINHGGGLVGWLLMLSIAAWLIPPFLHAQGPWFP